MFSADRPTDRPPPRSPPLAFHRRTDRKCAAPTTQAAEVEHFEQDVLHDPNGVRLPERIKAKKATINGVSLAPAARAIENGKKIIAFRGNRTASRQLHCSVRRKPGPSRQEACMSLRSVLVAGAAAAALAIASADSGTRGSSALRPFAPAVAHAQQRGSSPQTFDDTIDARAAAMLAEGRRTFRFDTFGSEAFWGDKLKLHQAIAGVRFGGVGPGLTPAAALGVGLKVDATALPGNVISALQRGALDVNDVANTIALLQLDAVIGVKAIRSGDNITGVGIECALCHSTVDDSLAPGIGRRLDGWPNRDLNVGAIIALAPDLSALSSHLGVDQATVRQVVSSWGPGKFDAELVLDGKAFQPDGRSAATLLPAAYGLAGVNLHTYTGWGSVTHWNAFVANLEMMGSGTFYDPRLNDAQKFPLAAKAGFGNVRKTPDRITSKLAALQYYQLSIPAPAPPAGSFDERAAERGRTIFNGVARCGSCHVAPIFSEPGWPMHTAAEIGIDGFQASRSPDGRYRTTPLAGLFARVKGGFYHDGRFPTLRAVVDHYDRALGLGLTEVDKLDLIEYLKSI